MGYASRGFYPYFQARSIFGDIITGTWKCEFSDLEIKVTDDKFNGGMTIIIYSPSSYALVQIWSDLLNLEPKYFLDCDEFKQIA
jgi:hypothetical protein